MPLPEWVKDPRPVRDPEARDENLEFFINEAEEDDALNLVESWIEATVPIAAYRYTDWSNDHCIRGNGTERETHRLQQIRQWYAEEGGWENALRESPPIALLYSDGSLEPVDGWHRQLVAYLDHQITEHPVILGIIADHIPNPKAMNAHLRAERQRREDEADRAWRSRHA